MKPKIYIKQFKKRLDTMLEITKKKNADYATKDDFMRNFKLIEYATNGNLKVEHAILTRMADKFQRIANLLYKEADVEDETISDTLIDLANYAIILSIYLERNKE